MKTKRIIVTQIKEVKTGFGKNGKPWTLRKVIDQDGLDYTTFNEMMQDAEVDITYEEVQNGKFTNRRIIDNPKRAEEAKKQNEVVEAINRNTEVLEEILEVVQRLDKK